MDPRYTRTYSQAQSLHNQLQNWLDDHKHPAADGMKQQMRALQDDMEMGKNPRSIEQRLQTMSQEVERLGSGDTPGMSHGHIDEMRRSFEDLRGDLRKM